MWSRSKINDMGLKRAAKSGVVGVELQKRRKKKKQAGEDIVLWLDALEAGIGKGTNKLERNAKVMKERQEKNGEIKSAWCWW